MAENKHGSTLLFDLLLSGTDAGVWGCGRAGMPLESRKVDAVLAELGGVWGHVR